MNTERWARVKAVFQETLDQPPDRRATFLAAACAGDAALQAEVTSLLDASDEATGFLETPALAPDTAPFPQAGPGYPPGRLVGPYRLLRPVGQGGMGSVYLAERADGTFKKQVAVKLVRRDGVGADLADRFRHERQILASLEHPHIARLLDGGLTDEDTPYLVMEYVEGLPIDAYCDAHQLSINERLHLFVTVCEAVQYAHRNLVVHRDLKPSNILVSQDGEVKLLDFGIAKLLGQQEAPGASTTRTYERILTPEYASPEQVRGEAVTTAADVYALGIILYELLAGQRPYRLGGLSAAEVERVVCQQEPTRPSLALTHTAEPPATRPVTPEEISQRRATQPEKLRRRLAGDLDVIVLMALRKDPARRYRSVEQFAEDVERHLKGLPVKAREETFAYRASKFVQRHRVSVAAAALVFVSLLGGIAATTWQARVADSERRKAEQRFADLRQLASSFMFEFHDAIADLPGSTAARELVVRRSLEYLDKLAREAGSDPSLQVELATAYRKVGDVQGNPSNANLGQTQEALASYHKAIAVARAALEARPGDTEIRLVLALTREKLADVLATTGDLDGADASMQIAVTRYREVAHARPTDPTAWTQYAIGLIKWGDLSGNPNFANRNDAPAALAHYRMAQPLLDSLYAADTTRTPVFRLRGVVYERLGTLYEVQDDRDAARDAYRASLDVREAYAAHNPGNTDAIRDLAIAHEKMGDVAVQAERLDEALARYSRARDIFETLWQADPMNAQARLSLAISYIHLGDLAGQPNLGDPAQARRHYRTALTFIQQLHDADSTNTRTAFLKGLVEENLRRLTG